MAGAAAAVGHRDAGQRVAELIERSARGLGTVVADPHLERG
jgi:hypothetical protein